MLKSRIYTVLVLLPLLLAALFHAPAVLWGLLLALLMLIGAWEWGALASWPAGGRIAYAAVLGLAAALLGWGLFGAGAWPRGLSLVLYGLSVVFWVVVASLWLVKRWHVRCAPLLALAGAILLLPAWLAMLQLQARPWLLLILMGIVWISDTAAYFCGKRWGRRKLAAAISPGKTWAGAFGAVAGVAAYYALVSACGWTADTLLQGATGCAVFLLLTLLGMEGDLFESWIKRTAGVKDSGTILPGHGGVLDRIDALVASLPAAALLLGLA